MKIIEGWGDEPNARLPKIIEGWGDEPVGTPKIIEGWGDEPIKNVQPKGLFGDVAGKLFNQPQPLIDAALETGEYAIGKRISAIKAYPKAMEEFVQKEGILPSPNLPGLEEPRPLPPSPFPNEEYALRKLGIESIKGLVPGARKILSEKEKSLQEFKNKYEVDVSDKPLEIAGAIEGNVGRFLAAKGILAATGAANLAGAGLEKIAEHSPKFAKTILGLYMMAEAHPWIKGVVEKGAAYGLAEGLGEGSKLAVGDTTIPKASGRTLAAAAAGGVFGGLEGAGRLPISDFIESPDVLPKGEIYDSIKNINTTPFLAATNSAAWATADKLIDEKRLPSVKELMYNSGIRFIVEELTQAPEWKENLEKIQTPTTPAGYISNLAEYHYKEYENLLRHNYSPEEALDVLKERYMADVSIPSNIIQGRPVNPIIMNLSTAELNELQRGFETPSIKIAADEIPKELLALPKVGFIESLRTALDLSDKGFSLPEAFQEVAKETAKINITSPEAINNAKDNIVSISDLLDKSIKKNIPELTETEKLDPHLFESVLKKEKQPDVGNIDPSLFTQGLKRVSQKQKIESPALLAAIESNANIEQPKQEKPLLNQVINIEGKKFEIPPMIEPKGFVNRDVIPAAKNITEGLKAIPDFLKKSFAPLSLATEGQKDIIVGNIGDFKFKRDMYIKKSEELKNYWDYIGEEGARRWAYMYEHKDKFFNQMTSEEKELTRYQENFGEMLYKMISDYKDIKHLDNWLPHVYKMIYGEKAEVPEIYSNRPLEGLKSFLKQRYYADLELARVAGKVPVWNIEEANRIKYTEVTKFVMAQKIKEGLKLTQDMVFVRKGQKIPDGFDRINDKVAKVYFPVETKTGETVVVEGGEWYAQKDAARLINNYLSKDYIADSKFKSVKTLNAFINSINLSFSAFHFNAVNTIAWQTQFAWAMQDLSKGKVLKSAGNFVPAIASSIHIPFLPGIPVSGISNYIKGDRIIKNAFKENPEALKILEVYYKGGGTISVPKDLNSLINSAKTEWKNNKPGSIIRHIAALPQYSIKPLMEWYIPKLKVGMFAEMYARNQENFPKKSEGEITREAAQNVDWLFGKMELDNLFWNNTYKSTMQLLFRSLTWRYGTYGIAAKGISDTGKYLTDMVKGNDKEVTNNMYILAGILFGHAMAAAIYQYINMTIKGRTEPKDLYPQGFKDLSHPRNGDVTKNGDDVRVNLPGYGKDIYNMIGRSPVRNIASGISPLLDIVLTAALNDDGFGNMAYNPDADYLTKAAQLSKTTGKKSSPFTAQDINRDIAAGKPFKSVVENIEGIHQARRDIVDSELTQNIYKAFREQTGGEWKKSPEAQDFLGDKAIAREELARGETKTFRRLIKEKKIKDPIAFRKNAALSPAQRAFKSLEKETKYKLYRQMTPDERKLYGRFLVTKL